MPGGYHAGVERLTKADRAGALAAAAAQDLNDELTVILSSISASIPTLEPGHPARPFLLEVGSAARRCASIAAAVLSFSARHGFRPSPATAERLVEIDRLV